MPLQDRRASGPILSHADMFMLRAIESGTPPTSSNHLVRLEMKGLVRDDARGLRLTQQGRRALEVPPASLVGSQATEAPLQRGEPVSGQSGRRRRRSFL